MKIYIAADHAGFHLKKQLIQYLQVKDFEVEDCGAYELDEADDYPDFIKPVAEAVSRDKEVKGIIIGKSGQGEAMGANRTKGVRAMVWYGGNMEALRLSREHNDSNVLSLGAGFIRDEEAFEAVKLWLETPFSAAERHIRRIKKLDA